MSKPSTTKTMKPSLAVGKLTSAFQLADNRLHNYVNELIESIGNHTVHATPQRRAAAYDLVYAQYHSLVKAMNSAADRLEEFADVVRQEQQEALEAKKGRAINFIVTALGELDLDEASSKAFATSDLESKGVLDEDTLTEVMAELGFEVLQPLQDPLPKS